MTLRGCLKNPFPRFSTWLVGQIDRDDLIGDLARDLAQDTRAPREFHELRRYILWRGSTEAQDALRRAIREWRAAKVTDKQQRCCR